MNRTARFCCSVVACLALSSPAFASLIGDEITARWEYPPSALDESITFTVDGNPVAWTSFAFPLLVDEDSISVDVAGFSSLASGVIWSFTDLDWLPTPGEIVGFSVDTSWEQWDDSFVSFTEDSIQVVLGNQVFIPAGYAWTMTLETRHDDTPPPVVPVPATALLVGAGLIALGWRRRRAA